MFYISPSEAVMNRTAPSEEKLKWAEEMARFYCARPAKADAVAFYTFLWDVFHAGEINGKRAERVKRRGEVSV